MSKYPIVVPLGHNLTVYFVLPLLGVNKDSFGDNKFINAYISFNGKVIAQIKSTKFVADSVFTKHPNYLTDFTEDGSTYIIYSLPEEYIEHFSKFLDGKYSEFTEEHKEKICKNSGLAFNHINQQGETICHRLLLVLYKHPLVKKILVKMTGNEEFTEYWSRPDLDLEVLDIDTNLI